MTAFIERHGPRDDLSWFQENLDDLYPLDRAIKALATRPLHVKFLMSDESAKYGAIVSFPVSTL